MSMISVSQAEQAILQAVTPTGDEIVPLNKALERTTRATIEADRDLPPFNRSTMDGIAINFDAWDQAGRPPLSLTSEATAGAPEQTLSTSSPESACSIMTGAVVPQNADTIIKIEDMYANGDTYTVIDQKAVRKGQFVHWKGSDALAGQVLVAEGKRLTSPAVVALASCGYSAAKVGKRVNVSVFSTGDELVPVEQNPQPHQIRQSNHIALAAVIDSTRWAQVHQAQHLPDNPETITATLKSALEETDWLVITGGVSKGRHDYVKDCLNELGAEILFHEVAQRPGKPMLFARWGQKLVFALPGNPNSALTCCHRYILPALQKAVEGRVSTPASCRLGADYSFPPSLSFFLPVRLAGNDPHQRTVIPNAAGNSGDFTGMLGTDGFIELPPNHVDFHRGSYFTFYPWQ